MEEGTCTNCGGMLSADGTCAACTGAPAEGGDAPTEAPTETPAEEGDTGGGEETPM